MEAANNVLKDLDRKEIDTMVEHKVKTIEEAFELLYPGLGFEPYFKQILIRDLVAKNLQPYKPPNNYLGYTLTLTQL